MRNIALIFGCLLSLCSTSSANLRMQESINYYVSTGGNDNNPGTREKPFRTIQKAADKMVAGDSTSVSTRAFGPPREKAASTGLWWIRLWPKSASTGPVRLPCLMSDRGKRGGESSVITRSAVTGLPTTVTCPVVWSRSENGRISAARCCLPNR